jgi:hypothetical protein
MMYQQQGEILESLLERKELQGWLTLKEKQRMGLVSRSLCDRIDREFWTNETREALMAGPGFENHLDHDGFDGSTGEDLYFSYVGPRNGFKTHRMAEDSTHALYTAKEGFELPPAARPWWYVFLRRLVSLASDPTPRYRHRLYKNAKQIYSTGSFYFEVRLLHIPPRRSEDSAKPCMSIGFIPEEEIPLFEKKDMFVGWTEKSIGYHTDDGYLLCDANILVHSLVVKEQDVIGCGVCNDTLFFKIGPHVFTLPYALSHDKLYPAIIQDNTGFRWEANFSQGVLDCFQ